MLFADDPAAYFGNDPAAAHALPAEERERLQQQALAHRLGQLLPRLTPLALLAELQGLDAGAPLDRAAELLYPHGIFKTYDHGWLLRGEFTCLTRWAGRFLARDLTLPIDDMAFPTIDSWLAWMEQVNRLDVVHSSGTTGHMSLVFRDPAEADLRFGRIALGRTEWYRAHGFSEDERDLRVIWPGPRTGRSSLQKVVARWIEMAADPAHVACLYESDLGADYELYVAGARALRAQGVEQVPQPSAYVEAALVAAEERFARREEMLGAFVDRACAGASGRRTMLLGGPLAVHAVARAGLALGHERVFGPQSFTCQLGGLKGFQRPQQMEVDITRFTGSSAVMHGYGMTELNAGFIGCSAGRYHVPPWIVPYVLDPAGRWAARPRTGVQVGRAGFLDLATMANWGGLATADHVTLDYGPCRCGRASPSIDADIKRVEDGPDTLAYTPAQPQAIAAVQDLLLRTLS